MQSYNYKPLDGVANEIRLIRLMPGNFDDDIRFSIFHAPLSQPKPTLRKKRIPTEDLQATLSKQYVVQETFSGRYLFIFLGNGKPNSWRHPDPKFDHSTYEVDYEPTQGHDPTYDALSYTWGDLKDPVTAFVQALHSALDFTAMAIGKNLASALRHYRYRDKCRTLWIDAICINQDDIQERNTQVKRMGHIYSFATSVLVWLGDEENNSKLALSTIDYFAQQVEVTPGGYFGDSPAAERPQWWNPMTEMPYDHDTWHALIAFFQRPWFSRVWVLQEVQLAGQRAVVQCGHNSITWDQLRKTAWVLSEKRGIPSELVRELRDIALGMERKISANFAKILQAAWNRKCANQRDKVYGVLSLASQAISAKIQPEYGLDTALIYKDAMLAHLDVSKTLVMIKYCDLTNKMPDAPSWVPNWSAQSSSSMSLNISLASERGVSGLSATQAKFIASNSASDSDMLEVLGKSCAQVSSVSPAAYGTLNEAFPVIRSWEPEGMHSQDYISGETLFEAFLEVVYRGGVRERYPHHVTLPTMEVIRRQYLEASLGTDRKATPFNHSGRFRLDNLSMFWTSQGYVGVASSATKPGDIVCVFLGLDAPIILRPLPNGRNAVVGRCFVHGLMDGEGILGPLPHNFKVQYASNATTNVQHFLNMETGERSDEDPRLPPLPEYWKRTNRKCSAEDVPVAFREFQNIRTGQLIPYDPRMSPQALIGRGIVLDKFIIE